MVSPRRMLRADLAIAAGGLFLMVWTFRAYELPSVSRGSLRHIKLSPSEADRRIDAARSRLQKTPNDFNAWTQLAVAAYQKGPDSYVDGLNALEKARSLGDTTLDLFYYAGIMYDALGLPDYAVNEFSKYRNHFPNDYEVQARLANAYFHGKRYDDALALYRTLTTRWSKDPTVWFNYAVVCKEKGSLDEAQAALEKAKSLAGTLPEGGIFQAGEIARLKGSDANAIPLYQQEVALHPNYLPALEALEAAQRRMKQVKEARETRQRINEIKKAKSSPSSSSPTVNNG